MFNKSKGMPAIRPFVPYVTDGSRAAQEIVPKGHFWMETGYDCGL
jgi:hypothetical protein